MIIWTLLFWDAALNQTCLWPIGYRSNSTHHFDNLLSKTIDSINKAHLGALDGQTRQSPIARQTWHLETMVIDMQTNKNS